MLTRMLVFLKSPFGIGAIVLIFLAIFFLHRRRKKHISERFAVLCKGCYHLHIDEKGNAKCELKEFGNWCNPEIKTYFRKVEDYYA